MTTRAILLIEGNPDDEALTLRTRRENNILNSVTAVHAGATAFDHLFSLNSADIPHEQITRSGRRAAAG